MDSIKARIAWVVVLLLVPLAGVYCQEEVPDAEEAAQAVEDAGPVWLEVLKDVGHAESGLQRLSAIVFILLLSLAAYWIVMLIIRRTVLRLEAEAMTAAARVRQQARRAVTVLGLLANVAKWVIGVGAILWVLSVMDVKLTTVLAGAGIVGIAVGFGAQTLVKDTISGFFLLLEGQYVVGDYIEVGGKFGLVEVIGLRVTVLKDLDNQLHYIPNGTITIVTVYEEHFVNYIVEVPMGSAEDAEKASGVIQAVIDDMLEDFPRHLPMAGPAEAEVAPGGSACVRMPVAIFPTQDWLATEELPIRVKNALARAEIVMPEGRTTRTYPDLSRMPLPPPIKEDDNQTQTTARLT